jgi:hypothetical protein
MRGVDDLCSELDRILRRRAGAGGIAGERVDHPDLDRIGGASHPRGHRREQRDRQNAQSFHAILPSSAALRAAFCGDTRACFV